MPLPSKNPTLRARVTAPSRSRSSPSSSASIRSTTPIAPARAARDHIESNPTFALGAGLAALRWLAEGYGFDITGADVWAAYSNTMKAAERVGKAVETKSDLRAVAASTRGGISFVAEVLGRELGLP